jgi:hypothetical protein
MSDDVNGLGRIIAAEMGAVLVRAPLDPTDDFFVCGGDSLRAVELISRLSARFGPAGSEQAEDLQAALLLAVFDDPSPGFLAEVVAQHTR